MADERSSAPTVQIALRISSELRDRVKAAAAENNRSVNSELTATLEEKYPAPQVEITMEAVQRLMAMVELLGEEGDIDLHLRLANNVLEKSGSPIRLALGEDPSRPGENAIYATTSISTESAPPDDKRKLPRRTISPSIRDEIRRRQFESGPDEFRLVPEPSEEEIASARRLLRTHPDREIASEFRARLNRALANEQPIATIISQIHEWLGDEDPDQEYEPA